MFRQFSLNVIILLSLSPPLCYWFSICPFNHYSLFIFSAFFGINWNFLVFHFISTVGLFTLPSFNIFQELFISKYSFLYYPVVSWIHFFFLISVKILIHFWGFLPPAQLPQFAFFYFVSVFPVRDFLQLFDNIA